MTSRSIVRDERRHRWRLRAGTVRLRLTMLASALVAVTLVLAGVGLVFMQKHLLTESVDESLVQRADNAEAALISGAFGTVLASEGDREDTFQQILDTHGRVLAATTNIRTLAAAVGAPAPRSTDALGTTSVPELSSHDFRVLARAVPTARGTQTLVLGKNLDDVEESVTILTTSLATSIPVVVGLLAILAWWLTGRVLAPVEAIRAEVASMRGADLDRRVSAPETDDEIGRLARTMNGLLVRVEQASEHQRQFVADASHELRSPLTRIRSALEVNIAHPEGTDSEAAYKDLLADATQLQKLVDDLLFLARSESDPRLSADTSSLRPARLTVDLDDLVLGQARQLRARSQVTVDTRAVDAARIRGDAGQLDRAIGNLASNAERHATSTVTFELVERGDRSELVVSDDGPGIPAEQRGAVFERFTRLDDARSRDAGGSGLGLAIVQEIVARHGGSISISSSKVGGARFVLTFPRAD